MDKLDIFTQTIDFAQAVVNDIAKGNPPNLEPWSHWSDALLRYVFHHEDERLKAQYLENLVRKSYGIADMSIVSANAQAYIAEANSMPYEDGRIDYEPPFDNVWPRNDLSSSADDEDGEVHEHWSRNTRPH